MIEIISTLTKGYKPESDIDQAAVIRWRRAAMGVIFAAVDEKPKDVVPALIECIAWDCQNEWPDERYFLLSQSILLMGTDEVQGFATCTGKRKSAMVHTCFLECSFPSRIP